MSLKFNKKSNIMEYWPKPLKGMPQKPSPVYVCVGFKIAKLYKPLEERYARAEDTSRSL